MIWTKACPGPGEGTGTSRISSGCRNLFTTAAFIVLGIVFMSDGLVCDAFSHDLAGSVSLFCTVEITTNYQATWNVRLAVIANCSAFFAAPVGVRLATLLPYSMLSISRCVVIASM